MKYLYYKLCQDFKRVKSNDTPFFSALLVMCMMHNANIATLYILYCHFFNVKSQFDSKNQIILFGVIQILIIFVVDYFLLYKNKVVLSEKYKYESKKKGIIGYILLFLYIIVSLFLVYIVGSNYPIR